MADRVVLTQFVLDWLAQSQSPRVLHVFDSSCNLINERDEIISIVWPDLGAGPFAIVLPKERPFTNITTDTKVNINPKTLQFGFEDKPQRARRTPRKKEKNSAAYFDNAQYESAKSLIDVHSSWSTTVDVSSWQIHLDDAILWQARPDWEMIQQKKVIWPGILPRLQILLTEHAPAETAVFQPKLNSAQQELRSGLQQNDSAQIKNGAKQLAGLGQGLTPTGDDSLVGAMIALWALEAGLNVLDLMVQTAVPRTTKLSGAWLQAAGRGEVVEVWHDFFAGLEDGGWETAVSKILQIGHSSGYDALVGFTAVLELFSR